MRDDRLPTVQQWQEAIDALCGSVVLDPVNDLRTHTGYLPARFRGQDSGFEWYYDPIKDAIDDPPEKAELYSHAASLVTHSDMRECVCAMFAGAALAKASGGKVCSGETGEVFTPEEALAEAKAAEAEYL